MSRVCHITGKRPRVGNTVSHANKKAKRRFDVNLHCRRLWLEEEQRFIRLRVSTKGLKTIDRVGVKAVLADIDKYRGQIAG